ncbi:MAG: DUF4412 domain-containing protein [Verrucomicrobiales bacterium]
MTTRPTFPSVMVFAASSFLALCTAQSQLTATYQVSGSGVDSQEITFATDGSKLRIDVPDKVSIVISPEQDSVLMIQHDAKMAMQVPYSQVASSLDRVVKQEAPDSMQATGETETIAGFACEIYEITTDGSKGKVWLTQDLPAWKDAAASLAGSMKSLSPQIGEFYDSFSDQGFMVKSEWSDSGKSMNYILQSVSTEPVPAERFAKPSGYNSFQLPSGYEQFLPR